MCRYNVTVVKYLSQIVLRSAIHYKSGSRAGRKSLESSVLSSVRANQTTAFLSHAHEDRKLAKDLRDLLHEYGVSIYIDWEDQEMPSRPDRRTAQRIKNKIGTCDWFLFLATRNSKVSRWCPWEIGYADQRKTPDKVDVVPT